MKRVIVYCEGPTEETFIKNLLAPIFYPKEILLIASPCNGVSKYSRIKRDLYTLCKSDPTATITTMLDYYGLPSDTPGINFSGVRNIYEEVKRIETAIKEDIGVSNLIPNLMIHEFEALLFSKPECFSYCALNNRTIQKLQSIRDNFETPEHINNNPNTAPSKRILELYPAYSKPLDGYHIAEDIGVDLMRQECKHFNEWVEKLMHL